MCSRGWPRTSNRSPKRQASGTLCSGPGAKIAALGRTRMILVLVSEYIRYIRERSFWCFPIKGHSDIPLSWWLFDSFFRSSIFRRWWKSWKIFHDRIHGIYLPGIPLKFEKCLGDNPVGGNQLAYFQGNKLFCVRFRHGQVVSHTISWDWYIYPYMNGGTFMVFMVCKYTKTPWMLSWVGCLSLVIFEAEEQKQLIAQLVQRRQQNALRWAAKRPCWMTIGCPEVCREIGITDVNWGSKWDFFGQNWSNLMWFQVFQKSWFICFHLQFWYLTNLISNFLVHGNEHRNPTNEGSRNFHDFTARRQVQLVQIQAGDICKINISRGSPTNGRGPTCLVVHVPGKIPKILIKIYGLSQISGGPGGPKRWVFWMALFSWVTVVISPYKWICFTREFSGV